MFKNIDETRLLIYTATAAGTAYLYKSLGLLDVLTGGTTTRKTAPEIIKLLRQELLAACFYYDKLPAVLDEKSQENAVTRARLYYYGSPIDYPNPPLIREAKVTPPTGNMWIDITNAVIPDPATAPTDGRLPIFSIIADAINMGNSTLPQKVPPDEEVKFLTSIYRYYHSKIIASWNSGIKTRIPHQPYLSCLPIVFEIIRKAGYESVFNEDAALYRCISYQETMRRELPVDDKKVIVDGINISTGKTVIEEPPPADAVVIPTKGPNAGIVIPVRETALM